MNVLTADALAARTAAGEDILLVDVREPGEYHSGHLKGALNIPMEQAASSEIVLSDRRPLVLVCQRGARAAQVYQRIGTRRSDTRVLEGGTTEWQRRGFPLEGVTTGATGGIWSLERQIRFTAGLLTLFGAAGSLVWHPLLLLAIIVGGGLMFTSAINWCGMGIVLARMPWNRSAGRAGE